jgi:integrase
MSHSFISTELLRRVRKKPPERVTDYRDLKIPGFVLRARPSGIHSWRVQLPDRRWLTLGRCDEVALADAREAAQRRRAQAALGQVIPSRKPTSEVTLRTFLDESYEPWMKATYRGQAGQVARIRWAFTDLLDLKLSDLSAARIDRWRSTRRNLQRAAKSSPTKEPREVSRTTINRDVAALRAALSRAVDWGSLSAHPLARMKPTSEDGSAVVRYLSGDEEQRLRAALVDRDNARRAARESANAWRRQRQYDAWAAYGEYTDYLTALVLVALNTGLRRGELLQLCWRDVQLEQRVLTVRGEGAKTGQTRHVPLNTEAVKVMKTWKPTATEEGWFVFSGDSSMTPLTEARKAWEGVLRRAKIRSFRFHDLRHTFASKLVMAGVDLNTVRELLGHRKIAMTLRYAHLAPQHKAAAVERLVAAGAEGSSVLSTGVSE